MRSSDVSQIEVRLGNSLPEDYRTFLTAYPADAPEELRRYNLFDDPAVIVEQTLMFRRYLTDETNGDRYIVIGDIGCGDRVCLDRESSAVVFWSHVDEDFLPLAGSVTDYYRLSVSESL